MEPKNFAAKEFFKGTANTWYCKDGRVIPVEKLDNAHLENILKYLHIKAHDELKRDNPYPFAQFGWKETDIWLKENCITYPAIVRETHKRGMRVYMTPIQIDLKGAQSNQTIKYPNGSSIAVGQQGVQQAEKTVTVPESLYNRVLQRVMNLETLTHTQSNKIQVLLDHQDDLSRMKEVIDTQVSILNEHKSDINFLADKRVTLTNTVDELKRQIQQLNNIVVQEKQNLNYKIDMQGASFNSFTSDQDKRIAAIANELRNINRFLNEKFSSYSTEGKL